LQNFDDYPEIDTRIAGIEMEMVAALINVINAKNRVTGEGIVNARESSAGICAGHAKRL
jgi:hypothetical protein